MPAKGKSRVTERQKATMVAGKLAGKTSAQVAAAVGLAPETVRSHWGGHDTLIAQMKVEEAPRLRQLFRETITAVGTGVRQKTDKRLQLHAGALALRLITAGDPPLERVVAPPPPPPEGEVLHVTLEELLVVYRQVTLKRGDA